MRAWWLQDDKVIVESGQPHYEIGLLDVVNHVYTALPRQLDHERYVQAVSPNGEWWVEYDEVSGELQTAFPDGSTLEFVQGYNLPPRGLLSSRQEPGFAITTDGGTAYFPLCSGVAAPTSSRYQCSIVAAKLHQGHAEGVAEILPLPTNTAIYATVLSSDDRYLFVGNTETESILIFDLAGRMKIGEVSWLGLGSIPYFLASPISDQVMYFEILPPSSKVTSFDALSGSSRIVLNIDGSLTPVEWHVVRP